MYFLHFMMKKVQLHDELLLEDRAVFRNKKNSASYAWCIFFSICWKRFVFFFIGKVHLCDEHLLEDSFSVCLWGLTWWSSIFSLLSEWNFRERTRMATINKMFRLPSWRFLAYKINFTSLSLSIWIARFLDMFVSSNSLGFWYCNKVLILG